MQAVQVMHHPLLKSNERYVDHFAVYYRIYCRSSLIPQHSEGKILFHVVLDMSVWNIKVVDEFQLSLLSPEIDEEGVFCNFQRSLFLCRLIIITFLIDAINKVLYAYTAINWHYRYHLCGMEIIFVISML